MIVLMVFNKTVDMMGFTKDAECDEAENEEDDDNNNDHCSRKPSDDWLGLSDQPLQGLLPALPLQLCSNHLPTRPVVLVQPVPLQRQERSHRCTWKFNKSPTETRRDVPKIVTPRRLIHVFNSYLLLGEQCCVDHFHLNRNQSQGLKRQATSVPVVVLKENKENSLSRVILTPGAQAQSGRTTIQPGFLSYRFLVKQFSAW